MRWRIVNYQKTNFKKQYLEERLKDFAPKENLVVDENGKQHLSDADAERYSDLYFNAVLQFSRDSITSRLITQDAIAYAYEDMFRDWKEKSYLALDLDEGVDFDRKGIDEALKFWTPPEIIDSMPEGRKKEIAIANSQKCAYLYGGIDSKEGLKARNMHTIPGKGITRDKILGQLSVDGKTDGISIAKRIYELAQEENPKLDLPDLQKWLKYCKTRDQDNQQYYEWNLSKDGSHKLKIYGTEKDKSLVDAYLAEDIEKISNLSKNGANPNIPVTYLEFGNRPFPEKGQEKFGIVEESTLPVLSQLLVRNKKTENPQAQISFINKCIDCGARFNSVGNQYVMPENCVNRISSPQVKSHIKELGLIAKKSEQEYVESGKKMNSNDLHNYIKQNVQQNKQAPAQQHEIK